MSADTGYGLDSPGFEPRQGWGTFLLYKTSRPALVLTQLPIKWEPGFFPGVKWRGRDIDCSSPPNTDVSVSGAIPSRALYAFIA